MSKIIYGIQQVGIGVSNLSEAWKWYKEHLGFDIRIFEDNTVAELMLPYTGGQPQQRHAALALNMQGGGDWKYGSIRAELHLCQNFRYCLAIKGSLQQKSNVPM